MDKMDMLGQAFNIGLGAYAEFGKRDKGENALSMEMPCKICNRGTVDKTFDKAPQIHQCSFCKTIHLSVFGWILMLEDSLFNQGQQEAEKVIGKVLESVGQMTLNRLRNFAEGPQMKELVSHSCGRFGNRTMKYSDTLNWMKLGASDFTWLNIPIDEGVLISINRVANMASNEEPKE